MRRKDSKRKPEAKNTACASRASGRLTKQAVARIAREVESLITSYENDRLSERDAERAQLISDILFDVGNESQVNATHPRLIKEYMLTLRDGLPALGSHERREVETALQHVHELVTTGCSKTRRQHIEDFHDHADHEASRVARDAEWGVPERHDPPATQPAQTTAQLDNSEAIAKLQRQLSGLENVPENEAVAFRLESQIYKLEREAESAEQWPDVIGDDGEV